MAYQVEVLPLTERQKKRREMHVRLKLYPLEATRYLIEAIEQAVNVFAIHHSGHQPFTYARVRFSDDYVYGFGETEAERYVALMGKLGCI